MLARNSHFLNEKSKLHTRPLVISRSDKCNHKMSCYRPSLPVSLLASLLPLAPPPELAKWHLLRLFCGTEKLHVTQRLTGHFWQHRQQDRRIEKQWDRQAGRQTVGQTARTNVNSKHWKMRQATQWEIKLLNFATRKKCTTKWKGNL